METEARVRSALAWQTLDFASLGIAVGARLQIIADDSVTATHHTFLVGYKAGHHLVTDPALPQPGMPSLLHVGQSLRVRWFSGVALTEFEASVLATYRSPINEMHLTWPQAVRAMPIRSTPRMKVDVPASVAIDGRTVEAPLRDLSMEGASFVAAEPVADVGSSMRLSFVLPLAPDDEVKIQVDAQLRAIRRTQGADGRTAQIHGMKFDALTRLDSLALRAYLATRPIDRSAC